MLLEKTSALEAMLRLSQRTGRNYAGIHTAYYRHLQRENERKTALAKALRRTDGTS